VSTASSRGLRAEEGLTSVNEGPGAAHQYNYAPAVGERPREGQLNRPEDKSFRVGPHCRARESPHPRQFASIVIIKQDFIRLNVFRQQDRADFAKAQRILILGRKQFCLISQRFTSIQAALATSAAPGNPSPETTTSL
jgi:hypothetical protein